MPCFYKPGQKLDISRCKIEVYNYTKATNELLKISKSFDLIVFHEDFHFHVSFADLDNLNLIKIAYLNEYNRSFMKALNIINSDFIIGSNDSYSSIQSMLNMNIEKISCKTGSPKKPIDKSFEQYYMSISKKKRKILQMLCSGSTNQKISEESCMSVGGVKNFLTKFYQDFEFKNRLEAAMVLSKKIPDLDRLLLRNDSGNTNNITSFKFRR